MSPSAPLLLAAAAVFVPAQDARPSRGVEVVEARVTARVLPAAIVRQARGPEPSGNGGPRPQLSRRGTTVLVEYQ
jgi:hypothetical protein